MKKKNWKSRVLTLIMAAAMVLCLAACGKSGADAADLTGTTWALNSGSQGDMTLDKETLESMFGGEMTYSFEADGKLVLALAGTQAEGTWSQDGNTITLDVQGDTGTMTLDGDTLSMEENGVQIDFIKK